MTDSKIETLELAAKILKSSSNTFEKHARMAKDIEDIIVIVQEWKKLKENKGHKMTEQTKPREFWLTLNEDDSPTHICLFQKLDDRKQLRLIEYSALLAAQAELQSARAENAELKANVKYQEAERDSLQLECDKLEVKLKTVVEALEAIKNIFQLDFSHQSPGYCSDLAIEALDKIKGEDDGSTENE